MGLGPPVLALYRQLKGLGVFEGISDVMELGAQNVWCPRAGIVKSLFEVFGKPQPPDDMLERFAQWKGSGRELYEALGFTYQCIDVDPNFDSICLDLNFDRCPPEHISKYGFVTNHGTSEHLLNQYNFFKITHELTKVGGFMLHAVPFTVHLEHGFFNYQPNFFESLAKYNSYKMYGIWVGPDWQLASFVPWEPELLDYLVINSKTTHLLLVVMQKLHDTEFCVPFQEIYAQGTPEDVMARYNIVVDGLLYDGKRFKHVTKEGIIAEEVAKETQITRNEYASLNGKYWDAVSKLATLESIIDRELNPLKRELAASLLRNQVLQGGLTKQDMTAKSLINEVLPTSAMLSNENVGEVDLTRAGIRALARALVKRIIRRIW